RGQHGLWSGPVDRPTAVRTPWHHAGHKQRRGRRHRPPAAVTRPGRGMRRVCLAALTACAVVCLPATATTTPQTLRPAMEQVLQQEGLVGAVWSTVAADGTVRAGAAGRRDADTGAPMLPETRTQVGSVTKAVLA